MTADRIPKALLPVGDVPIIFRQLRVLAREGVKQVSVLAGHLGDLLRPAIEPEAARLGIALRIIIEPQPLGTAGALAALAPAGDDVLVVYGDMLFDIALAPLYAFHRRKEAIITVVAHPNDHPRTSDLLVEDDGLVQVVLSHRQPRAHDHRNLVPAGLYLAAPAFLAQLQPETNADMINDVLPALVAAGARVAAYNTPEYLRDVGSPARHRLAEGDLAAGRVAALNAANRRPAIFFDCDGVLNDEPGDPGVVKPEDLKLIPGAGEAVRRARAAGLLTVAVTNRPQVAKGLVTFEVLAHILGRLEALLAEDGGVLDRLYFCPHYPVAGFPGEIPALKIICECRKPGTLLLRRAVAELPIEPSRSVLIGDSLRDIGCARGMGIWAYGVRTGYGCRDVERYRRENGVPPAPDLMFKDVSEAVDFAIGYRELAAPVLERLRPIREASKRPALVGVGGRSRSGKSVLAHAVVRALEEDGVPCLHVRLDDWIVPAAERDPQAPAEARARLDLLPEVVAALRAGSAVQAPGYDAASRGSGEAVAYDPAGRSVIVIEGGFAIHRSLRAMLDLAVFVAIPDDLQRQRFGDFYRWKGFDDERIDALWTARSDDEWSTIDSQRDGADLSIAGEADPA